MVGNDDVGPIRIDVLGPLDLELGSRDGEPDPAPSPMIFSIIGELSLMTTMTAMRATATMVAVTPTTTVMIVLGTSMNNRMEGEYRSVSYPDPSWTRHLFGLVARSRPHPDADEPADRRRVVRLALSQSPRDHLGVPPDGGEVDLRPLFDRLPGWRWVLPRVEDNRSVTFRDLAVPRDTDPFGMEQPTDAGPVIPIHEIDVFLVPGFAFDLSGGRLGNGAGHYDRILSSARGDTAAVGIAPAPRLVDVVPVERHDIRVGWLATEEGVISCAPNG